MQLVLIIVGAFVGGWVADGSEEMLGVIAGAIIGYLLAQLAALKRRHARLADEVEALRRAAIGAEKTGRDTAEPPAETSPRPTRGWWDTAAETSPKVGPESSDTPAATSPGPGQAGPTAPADTRPPADRAGAGVAAARRERPRERSASSRPSTPAGAAAGARTTSAAGGPPSLPVDRVLAAARDWITTGNVPVKVGVVISFFGVAFLLKYAVDRDLLTLPIELRLLGVAAGAVAMLVVGWRLRVGNAVYALSLQGGGIGILYLTIFAAFRLYGIVPPGFAFVLLVALTLGVGVLAVLQNSRWLAIFGTVGGFLAPVLTSTGQGSHVALFSYYLLLNAAILGISWYRAWRSLNVLGFLFTFGIGTLWGYQYYRPELYASTQPFLVLYFLFYQAIAVLFAFRQPPRLSGLVDGTILFGTPVVAFALQSRLVADTEYGLATSAAAVALFYVLVAGWLYRVHRDTLKLMVESYVALAVAFATIAIPLALDARWTAAAWALEGAALVWVGVRQSGLLARVAGAVLIVASGLSFIEHGWRDGAGIAVLNGNVLGGLLISGSALFGAHRLDRDAAPLPFQPLVSLALLGWGLLWWFGTGFREIDDRLVFERAVHANLLFAAASAAALAFLSRRLDWRAARLATLGYLPLLLVLAVLPLIAHRHWLTGSGWLAWPAALGAHLFLLFEFDRDGREDRGRWHRGWHTAGALLFAGVVAWEAAWRLDAAALAEAWSDSAGLTVLILGGWLLLALRQRVAWPLQRYPVAYLAATATLLAIAIVLLIGFGIDRSGDPAPLPYVPLLNPYDTVTLVALIVSMRCLLLAREARELLTPGRFRLGLALLGAAAFVLTTIGVVRAVHHVTGVPWSPGILLDSVSVQSALSIYWGLLGFAGMVLGARRAERVVWMLGTGMMAVVVAKLFLVDLGNSGTVARIVSFLGVGVLLLVVGYFAPAPPRPASAGADEVRE